jgi:PIN domain nuclease of toxin-antitoxin system
VSGRPILLDTCAALWLANDERLAAEAEAALEAAAEAEGLLISPITAWEIGVLVSRGRITLSRPPHVWFDEMIESGVQLAPMPPAVLLESSFLPGARFGDPADRILAATARAYSYRLMTRDKALLDYGEAGHLEVIGC